MPRLKWFTWFGVLGAGILGWSLLWLALSPYVTQGFNRVESLTYAVDPSLGNQVLTLLSAIFLALAGADWLHRR